MSDQRRCTTCANWVSLDSGATKGEGSTLVGECRRYAPQPAVRDPAAQAARSAVWPSTQADDFCGEWYYGGEG